MSEFSKFEATLKKKKIPQVFLIYGNEDYFISRAVDLMLTTLVPEKERSFNLDVIDGSDADSEMVLSSMLSFPFVGDRRLTVVRRFDKMEKKHRIDVAAHLADLPATNVIAFAAGELKTSEEPYKTIASKGEQVAFNKLKGASLTEFIEETAASAGKTLGKESADILVELVGDSAGDLASEVEKISIYVGERKEIGTDDIIVSVGKSRTYNIFELQRAIGNGDAKRAQEIAGKMLESGEKAVYINYMLTRYFLHLMQTKHLLEKRINTNEISTKVFGRWNPFMNEYVNAAKSLSISNISSALRALLDADVKLKSGGYQESNAVAIVVSEIVRDREKSGR
ncbi:MAG: DNA polymerase III subunit delta [Bacteroidetes bacterium]|nr:DNA polymerase III subunit delta [Bacteroidota bacterium]